MVDAPKPDTQAKLTALCKEISVAQDLDAEIQRELYAHMEDKLLAYLNGSEPVTEEDALILVRAHFGQPAVVKELLGQVHAWEASVTLARRLAAVFILLFALSAVVHAVHQSVYAAAMLAVRSGNEAEFRVLTAPPVWVLLSAMIPLVMWFVLRRWQQTIERGESLWLLTWTPARVIGLMALLYFLGHVGVQVHPGEERLRNLTPDPVQSLWVYMTFSLAVTGTICGLVLWWCDRPPRRPRAVAYAFAAWLVIEVAPSLLYAMPVRLLITHESVPLDAVSPPLVSLGHFFLSGAGWNASIQFEWLPGFLRILLGHSNLVDSLRDLGNALLIHMRYLFPGIVVALAYWGIQRWRSGVPIRLRFRTQVSRLIDMTYTDKEE